MIAIYDLIHFFSRHTLCTSSQTLLLNCSKLWSSKICPCSTRCLICFLWKRINCCNNLFRGATVSNRTRRMGYKCTVLRGGCPPLQSLSADWLCECVWPQSVVCIEFWKGGSQDLIGLYVFIKFYFSLVKTHCYLWRIESTKILFWKSWRNNIFSL